MDSVEELAILILAEGSLRYHNGYEIQFVNTDEALNDYFTKIIEDLGFTVKQKSPKQKVVYSRELAEKLLSLSPSYKTRATNGTYPQATFPEGVFADAGKTLQLFFSCEGGVVLSGKKSCEVILRVCHPTLKRQARQMLYSLGINHAERGNGLISIKRKTICALSQTK